MKWALCLSFFSLSCFVPNALSDELFIVTGESAYLLDEADVVVETASFFDFFEVVEADGDYLKVKFDDQELRVHDGLGHRTSQFSYIRDEHLAGVRGVFETLRKASIKSEDDLDAAIELAHQAVDQAGEVFEQTAPLEAWAKQYEAYLCITAEDFETAEQLLTECDAILEESKTTQGVQLADVVNVKGILHDSLEEYEEAIADYQQATLLLLGSVGLEHHDTAVVHSNLAYAHDSNGDPENAVLYLNVMLRSLTAVVPESTTEFADAHDYLGDLLRDNEQHEEAIRHFETALSLYRKHHPDLLIEIADLHTDLIYSRNASEDFDGAEKECLTVLDLISGMDEEDEDYYRRDITVRRGTIDFDRGDFKAALQHYEAAVAMADPNNFDDADGSAQESIGDTYVELEDTTRATAAYEKAIDIYAEIEGPESDTVLNLREYIDDLDSFRDESLGGYVLIGLPQGYLTDDDGNIIQTVPGLTVAEWYSSNDEFHEVKYNNKLGRIPNSQLHTRRLIPAYGVGAAGKVRDSLENAAGALKALERGDTETAEKTLQDEIRNTASTYGENNSLTLWLQLLDVGVQTRTKGTDAGRAALEAIQEKIDSLNPESYPLRVESLNASALIEFLEQNHERGFELLEEALEVAADRYGERHAMVFNLHRTIGKRLFQVGRTDESVRHLRTAFEMAQQIYPDGAAEIADAVSSLALVLSESEQLAEAAELLEGFLSSEPKLDREQHAMIVATLGKTYVGLDRSKDARKLLTAVVQILSQKNGETGLNVPSGFLALTELGKLNLSEEKWEAAAKNFESAVSVAKELDVANSFKAAEVHRQLSEALVKLDRVDDAKLSLQSVLEIYDQLGGGESPQAQKIRERLSELGDEPGVQSILARYFDFTPDGEAMYLTQRQTSAVESPSDNQIVEELDENAKVWSLESNNGYHRIYLPESLRFGWVNEDDLQLQVPALIEKAKEKYSERLKNNPAALKACFDAFAAARPENGFDDPQQAIAVIEASLKTINAHDKYGNSLSALLYEDLITYCQATGDAGRLVSAADEALSHFLSGLGYDHPGTAAIRSLRGNHHRTLGDYNKENTELYEILKICRKRFGPEDSRTLAQELGNAANLLRRGFFDKAGETYSRVIHVQEKGEGLDFLWTSATMGLGLLRTSEREYSAGGRLLQKAAEQFEKLGNPVPPLAAQTVSVLAFCLAKTGNEIDAIELLDDALHGIGNAGDPAVRFSIMTMRAKIAASNNAEVAVQWADEALQFGEDAFGADNFLNSDAEHTAGIAYAAAGRPEAWEFFDRARKATDTYLRNVVVPQSQGRQISFVADDQKRLNEALTLAMRSEDETAISRASEWLVNGHNVLPEIVARIRQDRARAGDTREQNGLLAWEQDRRRSADVPLKLLGQATPPYLKEAIDSLAPKKALSGLGLLTRMIVHQKSVWLETSKVRSQLNDQEVLVIFRLMDDPETIDDPATAELPDELQRQIYTAWIIPAAGRGEIQAVQLAPNDLVDGTVDQTLDVFHEHARRSLTGAKRRNAVTAETELLDKLAKYVWKPVLERLPAQTSQLTICADGSLHGVPWVALPIDAEKRVIDQYTVRHVCTPRDLVATDQGVITSNALMLSAPESTYQDPELLELTRSQQEILGRRTRGNRLHLDKKKLGDAIGAGPDLVGGLFDAIAERRGREKKTSPAEAQQAAFVDLHGESAETFTSNKASEYRFLANPRPKALHLNASPFALPVERVRRTAAFTNTESRMLVPSQGIPEHNPLMQCGVMLTGFGLEESKHHLNDGVLTAEEITSHDLRGTELVTLSVASKSPQGARADAESLGLLSHAFRLAGARTVASERWPVSREQTTELVRSFYGHLGDGVDVAGALREAQLEMRRKDSSIPVSSWASMRIVGHGWSRSAPKTESAPTKDDPTAELRELASKILKVYQKKNVAEVLAYTPDGAPDEAALKQFAPGTPRFKSLFGPASWRWKAVADWDGNLPAVYFMKRRQRVSPADATEAMVEFGRSDSEVFVVTLVRVKNEWKFDDIHSPPIDAFDE